MCSEGHPTQGPLLLPLVRVVLLLSLPGQGWIHLEEPGEDKRSKGPRLSSQRVKGRAAMKLLLGTLVLGGVCWLGATLDILSMPNFDKEKVVGTWYPLAYINIGKKNPQFTVKVTASGVAFSFKLLDQGKCKKKTIRLKQQGGPGTFEGRGNFSTLILDTDYSTYLITYFGQEDTYLKLAGRKPTISSDLEVKFRKVADSVGATGDIVRAAPEATC
ncbi:epididymal secretory protein 4-like [Erythrolamprus reginae]|uniref:epididymal secretory protein 4-like n=1 Tax=Erythrolamprus reginae TaxID=121349 RepID=UPI00396CAD64